MNKIIAVVKYNDGEAFVLEKPVELKYTKYGDYTIVGTDGCFLSCYGYERPIKPLNSNWSGWQAFSGNKFDLQLTDGTIEHCHGQWWDSITKKAREVIDGKIIHVTAQTVEQLKNCYVFTGYEGIEKEIKFLRSEYSGKIYEYYEYEKILKQYK